jgi:sulfofructosephosphate aldolase
MAYYIVLGYNNNMTKFDSFLNNGRILMLALDHRGSIEKMLPATMASDERTKTIVHLKKILMESLASLYSGVLFDSEYGLSAYNESTFPLVKQKPYLLCVEKSGYEDVSLERLTRLEHSVSQLKQMGAKGVKLLLFYHPDAKTAGQQLAVAKGVFEDCQRNELPFFLEILNYSLDGQPYDASALVPRSVKDFLDNGVRAEVFKLEFPGTADACKAVTGLLGQTPWILLTKGDTYEGFVTSLKIASGNGARGFLAGRSVWQDFAKLPQNEWDQFIATTVKTRFEEICGIALQ